MAPQIRDVFTKLSLYKSFGSRGTLGLLAFCVLLLATALGCGSGQGSSSNPANNPAASTGGNTVAAAGNNVQPVSVSTGPNFVVTTVTVCVPGGSCVDVPNVLVDTGSFGLRILASAVPGLALPQSSVAGGPLAECVQFIDNSLVWGSVVLADVKMAGEVASAVPIQLIGDPGLPNIPGGCGTAANAHDTATRPGGQRHSGDRFLRARLRPELRPQRQCGTVFRLSHSRRLRGNRSHAGRPGAEPRSRVRRPGQQRNHS